MQTTHLHLWAGIPAFMPMVTSGYAGVPDMWEAPTENQAPRSLRKAEPMHPLKILPGASNGPSSMVNPSKDLLSQSNVLCFGGMATLVPKQAILHLPETYTERLKIQPGVKIVDWAAFHAANSGWITTVEVTRKQAEGKESITGEPLTLLPQCRKLMVATYQGCPIAIKDLLPS